MKNPKVKAGHVRNETSEMESDKSVRQKQASQSQAKRQQFSKLTDKLAGDSIHLTNQPIPKGREYFPIEWKMRFADFYYPYAKTRDGLVKPLFIDIPYTSHDVALCERKFQILKEKGVRYVYVKHGEAEPEVRARLDLVEAVQ